MKASHRRGKRIGLRAGVAVTLAAAVAAGLYIASGGTASAPAPSGAAETRTYLAPRPDLALTPAGWVAISYGSIQVSVPQGWTTPLSPDGTDRCRPHQSPGQDWAPPDRPDGTYCNPAYDSVELLPAPAQTTMAHAESRTLNSIKVKEGTTGDTAARSIVVDALGTEVVATGPSARQVIATLTYSPWSVVTGSNVHTVPGGWHTQRVGGLEFATPASWPVRRETDAGPCRTPATVPAAAVTVADKLPPLTPGPGCPPVPLVAGTPAAANGLVVGATPLTSNPDPSASCRAINDVHVCVAAPAPLDSVLLAYVKAPSDSSWQVVEIGVGGDGLTALYVLDSIH